jgi:GTP-binding protein HflX
VVDASDPRRDEHIDQVNSVLEEIGAKDIPQIRVYNKIDRLEQAPRVDLNEEGQPVSVWISAAKGFGLDLLSQSVAERLERVARQARIRIPPSAGALRSRLYASGTVQSESSTEDGSIEMSVQLPVVELLALARTPGVQIIEQQGPEVPCTPGDAYLQSTVSVNAAKLP